MDKIMEIFLSRSFFNCRHALLRREFITNKGISLVKLQKSPYSKNVGSTEKKKKRQYSLTIIRAILHTYLHAFPQIHSCFDKNVQKNKKWRFGGRQSLGF